MNIIGIDEVGRGSWAGPLVAGAVLLSGPLEGLRDSKKLSKLQRIRLDKTIRRTALSIGIGWVWPHEIDANGLTWAVGEAMSRAFSQIELPYDQVIIDGNINYFSSNPRSEAIIRADDSVPAVSAASIIAKVARDTYMYSVAKTYPTYGFEKHVGYGTAIHSKALKQYGATEIHRMSYKPVKAFGTITLTAQM